MSWKVVALLGVVATAVAGCGTTYSIAPVVDATQQVRYERGAASVYSEKQFGTVEITPLGVNGDNRLGFDVTAYNKSNVPANFGTENLSVVQQDGSPGKIMTSIELEHEAKVKAGWQEFAVALGGALQSYAASRTAVSTTSGTAFTPAGPVNYYSQTYNPALAQANMEIINAQTGNELRSIEMSKSINIGAIRSNTLQTSTINPGEAYGGIAVVDELSSSHFPQSVVLHVNWNGEDHLFQFMIVKGTEAAIRQASAPLPAPTTMAPSLGETMVPQGQPAAFQPIAKDAGVAPPKSYAQWSAQQHKAASPKSKNSHPVATIVGAAN